MTQTTAVRKQVQSTNDLNSQVEREDRTPEFMKPWGVGPGGWQFIVKDQIRALTREYESDHIRVWAVGMLHTVGYKQQCAVKEIAPKNLRPYHKIIGERFRESREKTYLVPLTPKDISKMLGDMPLPHVSRAINKLEHLGIAEQLGDQAHRIEIIFYPRPKEPKSEPSEIPVTKIDNRIGDSLGEFTIALSRNLGKKFFANGFNSAISPFVLHDLVEVKEYRDALESAIFEWRETVAIPDIQNLARQVGQKFEIGNRSVIEKPAVYKEESSSKSSKQQQPAPTPIAKPENGTKPASWTETLHAIREHFPGVGTAVVQKIAAAARHCDSSATDEVIARAIRLINRRRKPRSEGLYLTIIGDFLEEAKGVAVERNGHSGHNPDHKGCLKCGGRGEIYVGGREGYETCDGASV